MTDETDLIRWELQVPETITRDALWRMRVYRLSLFASDVGWEDVTELQRDTRTRGLAGQLYRSLGSIGANIAEGYSRTTGKDRARFYSYALGSARESRDWYYKARMVLDDGLCDSRMDLLAEIVRQLLTIIGAQPGHILREPDVQYGAAALLDTRSSEEP